MQERLTVQTTGMPLVGLHAEHIGFDGGALPGEAGFGIPLLGSERRAETGRGGLCRGGIDGCFGGGHEGWE